MDLLCHTLLDTRQAARQAQTSRKAAVEVEACLRQSGFRNVHIVHVLEKEKRGTKAGDSIRQTPAK